jgi:hypothetical protein
MTHVTDRFDLVSGPLPRTAAHALRDEGRPRSYRPTKAPGHVPLTFHGRSETIDNTITAPITQDGWFAEEITRWVEKVRC